MERLNKVLYKTLLDSPIGKLTLIADEESLIRISFFDIRDETKHIQNKSSRFVQEKKEIGEYFFEGRKKFNIKYELFSSPFALKVYKAMQDINYGKTSDYSTIAKLIKNPRAYRAVGSACGKNPLPLIIPCHRVLSKNGIGGFTGGLERKTFLLKLETI